MWHNRINEGSKNDANEAQNEVKARNKDLQTPEAKQNDKEKLTPHQKFANSLDPKNYSSVNPDNGQKKLDNKKSSTDAEDERGGNGRTFNPSER